MYRLDAGKSLPAKTRSVRIYWRLAWGREIGSSEECSSKNIRGLSSRVQTTSGTMT
jgi:hypothetical protein